MLITYVGMFQNTQIRSCINHGINQGSWARSISVLDMPSGDIQVQGVLDVQNVGQTERQTAAK